MDSQRSYVLYTALIGGGIGVLTVFILANICLRKSSQVKPEGIAGFDDIFADIERRNP